MNESVEQKNTRLVTKLMFIVLAMFGFGYALVPIYDVFCEWALPDRAISKEIEVKYDVDLNREISIEFITSLPKSTPTMEFRAEKNKIKIHPGKYYTVNFYAKNKTNKAMVARAVPSVTPGLAAKYLKKTECFCFTEQTFEPHEEKLMPVRFVIDPELPEKYKTITLAYTFFDNTEKSVKK